MDIVPHRADQTVSRWRSFVQFPLVAMVAALLIYFAGITVALLLSEFAVPAIPGFTTNMKLGLLAGPILFVLYKLSIRRLGEIKRDDLRFRGSLNPLGWGLLGGLLLFSLFVLIAAAIGVYRVIGEGDGRDLLPALITSALFPAISEEMLFRGILFRWIEEFGGSWLALLLTSAFFGAAHLMNPHADAVAAIGIALEAGVLLGAAYMLTRSLWLPMGIHAAWNFAQGEIYDIPVSGTPVHGLVDARLTGAPLLTGNGFGLEASLVAIIPATLAGFWLLWLAIRRGELVQPWWMRRRAATIAPFPA